MTREPVDTSATPATPPIVEATNPAGRGPGLSKPDYRPRNRLDPHYRPCAGGFYRNRPWCDVAPEPWSNLNHRHTLQRRTAPWHRSMVVVLWLAALGAAGYGSYNLSQDSDGQTVTSLRYSAQGEGKAQPARHASFKGLPEAKDDLKAELAPDDAAVGVAKNVPENSRRAHLAVLAMPAAASFPSAESVAAGVGSPAMSVHSSLGLETESREAPVKTGISRPSFASHGTSEAESIQHLASAPTERGMSGKTKEQASSALAASYCTEALIAMQLCRSR